jgi:arylsulfatase A-like enzyme
MNPFFIILLGIASSLLAAEKPVAQPPVVSLSAVSRVERSKPNILFIMVDDLGKEWVGCYGAEAIKTPNIDALAAGGMKFHNAYSMPGCTPSRTTLLTGKYPWRTGYVNHWDVPRWGIGYFDWKKKENTTFARLMQNLGYATCAAGKWQINDFRVEPQAMKKHGFDDWAMWTGYETGNPPSENRYQDPYINTPDAGSRTYEGKFGPDIYTDRLIHFMRGHKDEPMCLYFPIPLLHSPFVTTSDEPDARKRTDRFKAMLRYVDKMVGQLVGELDELGIRERTIVIFTSDNGTDKKITGTRNGLEAPGGKGTLTEAGVNAPFIVNCPGLVPAGVENDTLVDLTDMLPTFVELGGGQVPEDLVIDGTSIAPVILGKRQDNGREWIMSLGSGSAVLDNKGVRGKKDFAPRVIRDKRYKVVVSEFREIDHLYDLQEDPLEKTNLLGIDLARHKKAVGKFQAVVASLPAKDARPLYEPRAANPWDRSMTRKWVTRPTTEAK